MLIYTVSVLIIIIVWIICPNGSTFQKLRNTKQKCICAITVYIIIKICMCVCVNVWV